MCVYAFVMSVAARVRLAKVDNARTQCSMPSHACNCTHSSMSPIQTVPLIHLQTGLTKQLETLSKVACVHANNYTQ
jgi:hypothetical protein